MVYRKWTSSDFYIQFLHLGPNIFRKKDESGKSYVYMWKWRGVIYYIGKGIGDRAIAHLYDMLSRILDLSWELIIVAENLSDKQACILEAKLIRIAKQYRRFSARGSYEWDGVSFINKVVPRTYKGVIFENLFEEYLNLNDRNWEQLEREINHY